MPTFFDKPHEKGYIKSFDGLKIYWEHHGAAFSKQRTPILFCYGLACSKHQWRSLAEMFVKEHPLIFFDYRGHHRSEALNDQEKRESINSQKMRAKFSMSSPSKKPMFLDTVWDATLHLNWLLTFPKK